VVGFFDLGTAWEGRSPFSEDNPLNINDEGQNLINVQVKFFRDPLVAGYGMGARAKIFGYFLRFDYAWGIETRQIQDPRFYFSLGTDF
jgi:outer membrane protein assembly factor BamA